MNPEERIKAGTAFATNTTVKTVQMVHLQLNDDFAIAFGRSLASNSTLEKVCLDSNCFSGTGLLALMEGLGQNSSITDFQVRHQTKTMTSAEELSLPNFLMNNKSIIKLGVDVRTQLIRQQIDRKLNENREYQRKQRRNGGHRQ